MTLITNYKTYLDLSLRAIEFSFTYYSPSYDVCLSNLIVIKYLLFLAG